MQSTCQLSVRLGGNLPSLEELTASLGVWASSYRQTGAPVMGGRDVWTVDLTKRERGRPSPEAIAQAVATLGRMQPGLLRLDRTRCRAELYVSAIRSEAETSLWFPPALIGVVAACQLQWSVSMPCTSWAFATAEQREAIYGSSGGPADDSADEREEIRNHYAFGLRLHGTESFARWVAGKLGEHLAAGCHWRGPVDPTALAQGDDEWGFEITRPETWKNGVPGVATVDRVLATLEALGRQDGDAELRIDCLCVQDFGGIELPAEVVAAAAVGGLALGLSIRCLDCGDDEGEDDD